jgi:hypothetical protein
MSSLRNGGIITETDYTGKTIEEATQFAENGGFIVRIVEVDNIPKMLDMSVMANRINFRVRSGRVTAAFGG